MTTQTTADPTVGGGLCAVQGDIRAVGREM